MTRTLCCSVTVVAGLLVVWFRACGVLFFVFQAEDGIRDLVRSRGLGDVYKRQEYLDAAGDLGDEADDGARQHRLAGPRGADKAQDLSLIHI